MSRYSNVGIRVTDTGKRYCCNVFYPEIELDEDDIYVITTEGDRYDKLAQQFYYDSSLWWVIAAANSVTDADSLVLAPGTQIRIPARPEQYYRAFEDFNT